MPGLYTVIIPAVTTYDFRCQYTVSTVIASDAFSAAELSLNRFPFLWLDDRLIFHTIYSRKKVTILP